MNIPSSQEPSPEPEDRDRPLNDAALRRLQNIWRMMSAVERSSAPGWGERLLPFIFAAMEVCWVDAVFIGLASIHFFQLREPVLPLWAPFVLIAGAIFYTTYLEHHVLRAEKAGAENRGQEKASSSPSLLFLLLAVIVLLIIWARIYAPSLSLLDPRWLWELLNDILLLRPNAYHVLGILVLAVYFCWRGVSLARRVIEPGMVLRTLRIGAGIFVTVIVVRAGTSGGSYGEVYLLLLLPLFLACALLAHSLAKALFVRQTHPVGLLGNVALQEGALLSVVGTICVFLILVALAVGTFASPVFLEQVRQGLAPVGVVYHWLVSAFAQVVVFLLMPIFWLVSLIRPPIVSPTVLPRQPVISSDIRPGETPQAILVTITILQVVLPLLFVAFFCLLIWLALRRRRVVLRRRDDDLHESVWSWELFWMQLRALLSALWPKRKHADGEVQSEEGAIADGEPGVRSIREIYRAFLRWAAYRGYPRKKDETPYEFVKRLNERLPVVKPESNIVTDAYIAVRYGEEMPDEAEVARVQRQWVDLQQKARVL